MKPATIAGVIFCWAIPLGWIAASPPISPAEEGISRTEAILTGNRIVMSSFYAEYKDYPFSLSELRSFARNHKLPLSLYDAFGNRFEYIRLNRREYIIRSFGEDGTQNTVLSDRDPSIVSWRDEPERGVSYAYLTKLSLGLFPPIMLAGAESPNQEWIADLHVDPAQNARKLIVRYLKAKDILLVAPHDQVDEFLWLPNGYQIVFTATGSDRYRDGIYLWNLLDDKTESLTDLILNRAVDMHHADENRYYISLMGIHLSGPTVYVYLMPSYTYELDPVAFHSAATISAIKIPESRAAPSIVSLSGFDTVKTFSALDSIIDRRSSIVGTPVRRIHKDWMALPFRGDVEQVLSPWTEFTGEHSLSPVLPYALWQLVILYADAMSLLSKINPEEGEIVRSLAVEMAARLATLSFAPTYLRAEARYMRKLLSEGNELPFHLSVQTIPLKVTQ